MNVRPKNATIATLVLASLLLFATPVRGADDTISHTVKKGDTLELLAAEFYGDRNHLIFIMVANDMQHPRALVAGEKLEVPASREIIADVGDSFDSLAAAYLGDKRRGKFLVAFNGLGKDASLAAGTVLSIPFQITHTAASAESLSSISAAYFGDSKNASMLRAYNFLDRDTVAAGDTILVPIHHVRVRASKLQAPDPQSQARSDKRRRMLEEAQDTLPAAKAAWRQGEYEAIKRDLIDIDPDFLDAPVAVEVGVLLGGSYVATGEEFAAIAAFKRVLERQPNHALDAYTYSPKIREIWQRAGGQVTTE